VGDQNNQELSVQIDTAQWQWLRAHHERGGLILVESMLDLSFVGERLVADDRVAVEAWLASRLLSKPTAGQIEIWNTVPDKPFSMLVVSPFVLIQEQGQTDNEGQALS